MLTLTDLFCGAGGSSTGAVAAGVQVRMAANHWTRAVQTHAANHPDADHDRADISQVDPRRYPRTDLLWASPECTWHSSARSLKQQRDSTPDMFGLTLPSGAAERSRATMWDVPRFAERHPYRGIVVENVVEVTRWPLWESWCHAMRALDYRLAFVFLNSAHAQGRGLPAPRGRHQSGGADPELRAAAPGRAMRDLRAGPRCAELQEREDVGEIPRSTSTAARTGPADTP